MNPPAASPRNIAGDGAFIKGQIRIVEIDSSTIPGRISVAEDKGSKDNRLPGSNLQNPVVGDGAIRIDDRIRAKRRGIDGEIFLNHNRSITKSDEPPTQ